jgi:hypothetical protein
VKRRQRHWLVYLGPAVLVLCLLVWDVAHGRWGKAAATLGVLVASMAAMILYIVIGDAWIKRGKP